MASQRHDMQRCLALVLSAENQIRIAPEQLLDMIEVAPQDLPMYRVRIIYSCSDRMVALYGVYSWPPCWRSNSATALQPSKYITGELGVIPAVATSRGALPSLSCH
jgi:hypothetical protein